jgi:hypothetical protein
MPAAANPRQAPSSGSFGAVHDGHERSEFGRMQASRRPNQCLAVRQEGKGIRVIRIDAELLNERTSLGQLDRNEAKIAAAITFAHEAAAARA